MKMVSAVKFAKVEKELRAARSYGLSAKALSQHTQTFHSNPFDMFYPFSFLRQYGR